MRYAALALIALSGCASDFIYVRTKQGAVELTSCGTANGSVESVIKTIDNLGGSVNPNGDMPPEKELVVCLVAANKSDKPVRIDRSHSHLRVQKEREEYVPDKDDDVFVLQPGDSRKFHLTFHYGQVPSGDTVTVELDDLHAGMTFKKR